MRINQYLQLASFFFGLTTPLAMLFVPDWRVLLITAYVWLVGFLAALWDRYTWRRE